MTPGIVAAKRAKIDYTLHEYEHDPASESFGMEAAEKLGVPSARVFKTLVVALDGGELAVGIIPVDSTLGMKQMAKAAGAKKAAMAPKADVERATGYVVGGVSPLGQKKRLRTFIDSTAESLETIFVSAGRRGLDIELSPGDLQKLTSAKYAPLQHRAGD
ncbi:MAG: Cys-tRNA(Pro) deacylase [Synergistota bacterium]|nr:Cys-tRNA(Pro) deacylase [Synergistota bacterium]